MKDKAELTKLIIGFVWGHLSSYKNLSYVSKGVKLEHDH